MEEIQKPLTIEILKSALRHYYEFSQLVSAEGISELNCEGRSICFFDLQSGIANLPEKQKEALFLNVIQDRTEAETAELMGYTSHVWIIDLVEQALTTLLAFHNADEDGE